MYVCTYNNIHVHTYMHVHANLCTYYAVFAAYIYIIMAGSSSFNFIIASAMLLFTPAAKSGKIYACMQLSHCYYKLLMTDKKQH